MKQIAQLNRILKAKSKRNDGITSSSSSSI